MANTNHSNKQIKQLKKSLLDNGIYNVNTIEKTLGVVTRIGRSENGKK